MEIANRKSNGFTVIEFLVVIAIISLLVGILFPSLIVARQLARAVVCKSDLHGYGSILVMFTNDYDGRYPQHSTSYPSLMWHITLPRDGFDDLPGRPVNYYFADGDRERACIDDSLTWAEWPALSNRHFLMYNYALWMYATRSTITRPTTTVSFCDGYRNASGLWVNYWMSGQYSVYPNIGDWHGGGANLLFLDGHAEHRIKCTDNMTPEMWKVYEGNRATAIPGYVQ